MDRDRFVQLVEEALDEVPEQFRERIHNLAVIVEDLPPRQRSRRGHGDTAEPGLRRPRRLILGVFQGIPATQTSVFNMSIGPNRIVLYQKNIEAVCSSEAEIRHQVRQTVFHELGHYFGMNEAQLRDV